jgi:mono/diheme cytochrome c family protein
MKKFLTKSNLIKLVVAAVVLFLLIQLIPFGRSHANPPVVSEPKWDSPETKALFKRACFDCHSNETVWPWYSNVAPMSWLVQMDVNNGRSQMNFSEWNANRGINASFIEMVIKEGEMPPPQYLMMHPEARLTQAEKDQLVQGIQATLAKP